MRRCQRVILAFLWATAMAPLCFAGDDGITVDPLGHPRLSGASNHPVLKAETPQVDQSATHALKGKVADWSLFDLGIEYDEKLTPPPPKVLIKKVRLGSWAARAGLEAGDLILRVDVKRDGYSITIDRNDKVYRAELSK